MTSYTITYNDKDYVKPFEYSEVTEELDKLRNRFFTKDDLYKITLWKVNRFPIIGDDVLKKLNSLRLLKSLDEEQTREVLEDILAIKGVRLPMASTYLRFLNPYVYQIIDVRAYRAAFDYSEQPDYTTSNPNETIEVYFKYLKRLRLIAKEGYHGYFVKFENLDRFLYDVDKTAKYTLEEKPEYDEKVIVNSIKAIINYRNRRADGI